MIDVASGRFEVLVGRVRVALGSRRRQESMLEGLRAGDKAVRHESRTYLRLLQHPGTDALASDQSHGPHRNLAALKQQSEGGAGPSASEAGGASSRGRTKKEQGRACLEDQSRRLQRALFRHGPREDINRDDMPSKRVWVAQDVGQRDGREVVRVDLRGAEEAHVVGARQGVGVLRSSAVNSGRERACLPGALLRLESTLCYRVGGSVEVLVRGAAANGAPSNGKPAARDHDRGRFQYDCQHIFLFTETSPWRCWDSKSASHGT